MFLCQNQLLLTCHEGMETDLSQGINIKRITHNDTSTKLRAKPLNDLVILRHKYINQLRWLHKIFLKDLN